MRILAVLAIVALPGLAHGHIAGCDEPFEVRKARFLEILGTYREIISDARQHDGTVDTRLVIDHIKGMKVRDLDNAWVRLLACVHEQHHDERRSFGDAPAMAATVVRVIDGDTVEVDARPWPGQTIRVAVRLSGYDAPELHGGCAAERAAAASAAAALERLLPVGAEVQINRVHTGKFARRVVAQVVTAEGKDPIESLLDAGHGRAYLHGWKLGRPNWCGPS